MWILKPYTPTKVKVLCIEIKIRKRNAPFQTSSKQKFPDSELQNQPPRVVPGWPYAGRLLDTMYILPHVPPILGDSAAWFFTPRRWDCRSWGKVETAACTPHFSDARVTQSPWEWERKLAVWQVCRPFSADICRRFWEPGPLPFTEEEPRIPEEMRHPFHRCAPAARRPGSREREGKRKDSSGQSKSCWLPRGQTCSWLAAGKRAPSWLCTGNGNICRSPVSWVRPGISARHGGGE